jgi:hypothetical protein
MCRFAVQITARLGRPTLQPTRQYATPTTRWIKDTKLQQVVWYSIINYNLMVKGKATRELNVVGPDL